MQVTGKAGSSGPEPCLSYAAVDSSCCGTRSPQMHCAFLLHSPPLHLLSVVCDSTRVRLAHTRFSDQWSFSSNLAFLERFEFFFEQ